MIDQPTVLCYGEALWDLAPGGKTPGGAPTNVALHLARLGVDVRLLSRVGIDDLGRELLDYLTAEGLATDSIQIDQRHPTGRVLVDTSDPHAVRYEIVEPAAWDFIDVGDLPEYPAHAVTVVVFGSLATRNTVSRASLFRLLGQSGLKVFDVNLRPPFVDRAIIEQLLVHADWVKLNDEELELLGGWHGATGPPEHTLRALSRRYGLETVCLTLGSRGALMLYQDQVFRQAAFAVRVVDTIGCGDAFLAFWLSQMLGGRSPQEALTLACAVGALVATREGANPVIDESEIRALIGI